MKKILIVMSHPDDESFTCGGTVAKYTSQGWKVDLVCATRGEAGQTGPYGDITREALGEVRQKELEKAAIALGISSVTFLGFRDGKVQAIPPGELEEAIYKELVRFAPDVVITFEPQGITNHTDHMKTCLSTTYAFQKYADDVAHPNAKKTIRRMNLLSRSDEFVKRSLAQVDDQADEPKLYYACIPQHVMVYLQKKKTMPKESFGKTLMGAEDKKVTTVIDVSQFVLPKLKALKAHASQEEDVMRFVSLDDQPLVKHEYFILRMQGLSEVFMGNKDTISDTL